MLFTFNTISLEIKHRGTGQRIAASVMPSYSYWFWKALAALGLKHRTLIFHMLLGQTVDKLKSLQ